MRRFIGRGHEQGGGGESLEMLILAPTLLLLMAVIVAAGRYQLGSGKIDQAAGAAARAASLQLTAVAAQSAAQDAAASSLAGAGITCQHVSVQIDTSGFAVAPGSVAAVTASVACTVAWSDLAIPGLPGSKTIRSTASSPVDTKRVGT